MKKRVKQLRILQIVRNKSIFFNAQNRQGVFIGANLNLHLKAIKIPVSPFL